MRPPHCAACGDQSGEQRLVRFADYRPLPERMTGHPHGLEWFCARHAGLADRYRHLPVDDALARIARRRWWWPFG